MHDTLTAADLRFTPPDIEPAEARRCLRRHWRMDGDLKRLVGERDQNFRVTAEDGRRYVLKISSPIEDPLLVDFQAGALQHVEREDPGLPVPRVVPSREGRAIESMEAGGATHAVRLLTYVPGVPWVSLDSGVPLDGVRRVGRLQGRLCRALVGFSHPAETHFMPWDTLNGLVESEVLRRDFLPDALKPACEKHLERLERDSLPRMRELPAQVIHNDAHTGNVLCDPADPARVTGIIDFGDLVRRPILVDIATSLASFIGHTDDPPAVCGALVRGFEEQLPLPDEQRALLLDAVIARALLTVELLAFRVEKTDAPATLRTEDVPDSIVSLAKALALDPDVFLASR